MLDVDHFKKVNDTYGQDAGDEVLRALADAGTTDVCETDIFARIGGEEFVALLPETDLGQACAIAEKLYAGRYQSFFGIVVFALLMGRVSLEAVAAGFRFGVSAARPLDSCADALRPGY